MVRSYVSFEEFCAFVHACTNVTSVLEQWTQVTAGLSADQLSSLPENTDLLRQIVSSFDPRLDRCARGSLARIYVAHARTHARTQMQMPQGRGSQGCGGG
jgi:hypothetical protein